MLHLMFYFSKCTLAVLVPTLHHLHLGYCKQLTDNSINAIATQMKDIYSLDVSFCTRITISSNSTSSCLSILDVRYCGSQNQTYLSNGGYHINDPFVDGMLQFNFEQKVPGFFVRKVQWNYNVHHRFVQSILSQQQQKKNLVAFES